MTGPDTGPKATDPKPPSAPAATVAGADAPGSATGAAQPGPAVATGGATAPGATANTRVRRRRRRLPWRGIGAGVAALLIVTLAGLAVHTRVKWPAPPSLASLRDAARAYDVRILRDRWGVPHIHGDTDAATAFGLGYAHAEDDWPTLERVVLMSRGDLAAHDGAQAAMGDYLVHLFRVRETVAAGYETDLSAATRALLDGYAAGLNLWAGEHPEAVRAGVLPVTGQDIVAGFVFRVPFFFGLDRDLAALVEPAEPAAASRVAPRPATTTAAAAIRRTGLALRGGLPEAALGSNAIAVAPARAPDGHTRLLVNSHQPYEGPVAWYEVRLKSDEGWDAIGATFPGAPVMLHGANRHLGWAHTVNKPDLVDTFKLIVDDPAEPERLRFDGRWVALDRRTVTLRIGLAPGFAWPVTRDVLWSPAHDAPVIETPDGFYAIRHAAQGAIGQVEQWLAMNKARDLDAWMAAMARNQIPSFNTVYADRQGNIAFVYNARVPARAEGWPWRGVLPGDLSTVAWASVRGFDAVPRLVNPAAGYVVSANHSPLDVTDAPDNLAADTLDPTLGVERGMTNRALRARALYGGAAPISRAAFIANKFDTRYAPGSAPVRLVVSLLNGRLPDTADNARKRWVLEHWNANAEADNPSAALVLLTALKALDDPSGNGRVVRDPVAALHEAADELMRHHGRLDVPWGAVMRLDRGRVDAALSGGPDTLRALYGGDTLDPDGRLRASVGDSYILVADWAADGTLRVDTVHQYGVAVHDTASPHYDDQARLFADETLKPMALDLETVAASATRDYRPGADR
ncbi:hypothetical protein CCR85_12780 [Rhodothalassium salexigens]|nr:hypothetical protein [Rhodothalassium salexigens]